MSVAAFSCCRLAKSLEIPSHRVAIVLPSGQHSFDDFVEHEQQKQLHNALWCH
jgi:hypothetical protein